MSMAEALEGKEVEEAKEAVAEEDAKATEVHVKSHPQQLWSSI